MREHLKQYCLAQWEKPCLSTIALGSENSPYQDCRFEQMVSVLKSKKPDQSGAIGTNSAVQKGRGF